MSILLRATLSAENFPRLITSSVGILQPLQGAVQGVISTTASSWTRSCRLAIGKSRQEAMKLTVAEVAQTFTRQISSTLPITKTVHP